MVAPNPASIPPPPECWVCMGAGGAAWGAGAGAGAALAGGGGLALLAGAGDEERRDY